MATIRPLATVFTVGLLVTAVACGPDAASPSAAGSATTAQPTVTPQNSTPPPSTPQPTTPPSTPTPTGAVSTMQTPPGPAGCSGGAVSFTQQPGDERTRSLCVSRGATVTITLLPARGYRWADVQSSDPAVAAVAETHTDADGTGHAVIRVRSAGTVEITSSDTYTPDRFGPPTQAWTLRLQVR